MIVHFNNQILEYYYLTPLDEIRGKQSFSKDIIKQFKKKVQLLSGISRLGQLRQFKGLNFEFLKGDRSGECSIRLNDQFRLIFRQELENHIEIILIIEISKHYE